MQKEKSDLPKYYYYCYYDGHCQFVVVIVIINKVFSNSAPSR